MTLSERVQRAGNALVEQERSDSELLQELRAGVQEVISADALAKLAKENPERARNEVRSACRRVFGGPGWEDVGREAERRLVSRLLDAIFGYGVLEDLIADESITEVIANGPGKVFVERDGKLSLTGRTFSGAGELRALVDRILGPLGRRIDEASPMVNARTPQGHRVNVVVPPIAIDGPYLTIRKFSSHVITLEEMEGSGSLDGPLRQFLAWAVRARRNIAVSGGTGSGKTTLLNALSCIIPPEERIAVGVRVARHALWNGFRRPIPVACFYM